MIVDQVELALRLVLAAGAGAVIGIEREARDQAAGLRTHMLVALGAGLFAILSLYGFEAVGKSSPGPGWDSSRIASTIVSGVGFLGAGTIMREGFAVRGLTTAASLWATAAIGTAAGFGFWIPLATAVAIILFSLVALRPFRDFVNNRFGREQTSFLVTCGSYDVVGHAVTRIRDYGASVISVDVSSEGDNVNLKVIADMPSRRETDAEAALAAMSGVVRVQRLRVG